MQSGDPVGSSIEEISSGLYIPSSIIIARKEFPWAAIKIFYLVLKEARYFLK